MRIAAFFLLLALAGCADSESGCGQFDDDCKADYAADMAADNAEASNVDPSAVEEPEFTGCTDDCSGHEAGFNWAQTNDVTDVSECTGNSDSFDEGCETFAQARAEQAQEEAVDAIQDPVEDE